MNIALHHVKITAVHWQQAEADLRTIRTQVFIYEQGVPIDLEWDGLDETAQHLLAVNDANEPVACARLLNNGSIGRMAVLKAWRGQGVGFALLKMAINMHTQQGVQTMMLPAQIHAIAFYEKAGFVVCSAQYLDANILHVDMQLLTAKHKPPI